MKIALYTQFHTMLLEKGIAETVRYACERGFSGVELYCDAIFDVSAIPDVKTAKEVRRALEDGGLSMVCVSAAYDAVRCPDAVGSMKKYIEIAEALGSPFLHHTLLINPVLTDTDADVERKLVLAADAAVAIAHAAKDHGLTCLYEDQGRYVNGVARFSRFFRDVQSRAENVGVCGDLGNILFADEKPEDFVKAFLGDIKHVHVKDYLHKKSPIAPGPIWKRTHAGNFLRNTVVGDGVVDLDACMRLLKEGGYSGAFALELDHPEPIEGSITQAMLKLHALWENDNS